MNIHSVIDIITNSSNESFMCQTELEYEVIKEIVNSVILFYNHVHDTEYYLEQLEEIGDVTIGCEGEIWVNGDLHEPEVAPNGLIRMIMGIFEGADGECSWN